MVEETKLTRSLEDYLEAILILERKNRVARVKDIAHHLGVQMPSVTGALKNLKKRGYINYEKNSFINLTQEGLTLAGSIQSKHNIILHFLEKVLLIPSQEATEEACRIEHAITKTTAERLKRLTDFLEEDVFSRDESVKDKLRDALHKTL